MRINIDIDVGLHRGGVARVESLGEMLVTIQQNADHLEFSGFMGYDPHVVKLPRILGSRDSHFAASQERYRKFVEFTQREYPRLWNDQLTLNGAGSPTYRLHEKETLANDLAVGSALVKPADFDLDILEEHIPALFIATPVLKVAEGTRLPGAERLGGLFSLWDRNRQRSFFMYGGRWMATFASPPGLRHNGLFGYSSNQELVNGSAAVPLEVDDHIFLRPTQSEAVMLQFGDIVCLRDGKIVDSWPVFQA
jgi:D-serine deaminase-like pyridoxal phosphate-dependent protein